MREDSVGTAHFGAGNKSALTLALAILLATASPSLSTSTARAQTPVRPGTQPELRATFATTLEIAEGKRIAEASCAACHGMDGLSKTPGLPHLAGQRPGYLYLELKAYRSGERNEKAMESVLKKYLSEDALINVAAYYGSLDPPQPDASVPKLAAGDPVQAGKTAAAAACAGCHGQGGVSRIPGMPSLVGLDPKYLVLAMKAYKDGTRKDDTMKSLLANVSDESITNMAFYYALEKPARAATPSTGDAAKGKAAAANCGGCHGDQGVSSSPANPSLAGQDAQYLAVATRAYKDGARTDETMKSLVGSLDDAAIKDIAAFYASQQPQPPKVRKPLSTEEWVQRCDRCHGLNGNSSDPRLPALAAQRLDYLEKVLVSYRTRARKAAGMAAMTDVLSETDVKNLANYYARQKAKSVVFVPSQGR